MLILSPPTYCRHLGLKINQDDQDLLILFLVNLKTREENHKDLLDSKVNVVFFVVEVLPFSGSFLK